VTFFSFLISFLVLHFFPLVDTAILSTDGQLDEGFNVGMQTAVDRLNAWTPHPSLATAKRTSRDLVLIVISGMLKRAESVSTVYPQEIQALLYKGKAIKMVRKQIRPTHKGRILGPRPAMFVTLRGV